MTFAKVPSFTIKATGAQIPAIGFGSGTAWRIKKWSTFTSDTHGGEEISELVEQTKGAIQAGFRHIDTAQAYFTWYEVGQGIKASGVPREDLFITDKWSAGKAEERNGLNGPYESLTKSLEVMGLDYVDLYLIHTPREGAQTSMEDGWLQIEKLYKEGKAKQIGVSNCSIEWLERIGKVATIKPMVNQIEFHAYLQEQSPGIIEYCNKNDILLEAYCPLAPIVRSKGGALDELLPKLAEKYGRSETQILLRWVHQQGIIPLTTSSKPERLVDALNTFTFELEDEDVKKISEVGKQTHYRAFMHDLFGDTSNN